MVPAGRRRTSPVIFTTYSLRIFSAVCKRPGVVRIAHNLQQTFPVAQVDEDHAAVVAAAMHPAVERDGLVEMTWWKRVRNNRCA